VLLAGLSAGAAPARPTAPPTVELVVTLKAPPLADAPLRSLAGLAGRPLRLDSAASRAYLAQLGSEQDAVVARIRRAIPGAWVHWRYSLVLDGLAVVVPAGDAGRLARVAGVARVWPSGTYRPSDARSQQIIGAPQIWGPTLANAGQGVKIAVVDEGIDQLHPFFNPAGFSYPPGYPKGNTAFTTPKVIVARSFPPPGATSPVETLPFTGLNDADDHGTHVAGIAAGDANTPADGSVLSGIAPRAYLGNYKALAVPTPDFGLDGNAPEITAAIEAAVRDGMNVINLSIGEVEIDPARDVVVRALDGAADAGVVPVVAAGNDFEDFGNGSIGSPGNAPKAISVAASTGGQGSPTPDRIASFSSGGPTPYSLQFKPDVTAPGVNILSSLPAPSGQPRSRGGYGENSGTSMATPHVAGAAALLMQRHPGWTVAQIKSALVLTGSPVRSGSVEVPATREGGGRIDLVRADDPLVFAQPTSLAFGLLRPGRSAARTIALADAGGGGGAWSARALVQGSGSAVSVALPSSVTVPGSLKVRATVRANARERDVTGFVVLSRTGATRRLPFWFRIERPRLGLDRAHVLTGPGTYGGTTVGASAHVSAYRYPDLTPTTASFPVTLRGPEVVYRFRLKRPAANFGVVVTGAARGLDVEPRIVRAGDENRLAGYTALPMDLNPYRTTYGAARRVAGVLLPSPGVFDVVFDTTARSRRGRFTFRFWVDDVTPPSIRVLSTTSRALRLALQDAGAGVDPVSVRLTIDGRGRGLALRGGVATVSLAGIAAGRHTVVVRASDYQETKNTEDVGPVLPNTRTLRATITVP
jgi:subtilisin family serine protease